MLCRVRRARFSLQLRGKQRAWGKWLAALLCQEEHSSARQAFQKPCQPWSVLDSYAQVCFPRPMEAGPLVKSTAQTAVHGPQANKRLGSDNVNATFVQPGAKIGEVRLNKLALNIRALLLSIPLCAAGIALAHALPHHAPWALWHFFALLGCTLVLLPIHECLHALGHLWFAKVSWKDIRFGIMWPALILYCGCKVPVPVWAYRRMALLPLVVTGTATVTALLFFPADWLGLLAATAIAACTGDVWTTAKLSRFAGNLFALDTFGEIGCSVLAAIPSPAAERQTGVVPGVAG
jgi:hypothetical protein